MATIIVQGKNDYTNDGLRKVTVDLPLDKLPIAELVSIRLLSLPHGLVEVWFCVARGDYGPQFERHHFSDNLLKADVFVNPPVTVPPHMHSVNMHFWFKKNDMQFTHVPDVELKFSSNTRFPGEAAELDTSTTAPEEDPVHILYWQRVPGYSLDLASGVPVYDQPNGALVDPSEYTRPSRKEDLFYVKTPWVFWRGLCGCARYFPMEPPPEHLPLHVLRAQFWEASFKEFIQKTWHPSRAAQWCFAYDDVPTY